MSAAPFPEGGPVAQIGAQGVLRERTGQSAADALGVGRGQRSGDGALQRLLRGNLSHSEEDFADYRTRERGTGGRSLARRFPAKRASPVAARSRLEVSAAHRGWFCQTMKACPS